MRMRVYQGSEQFECEKGLPNLRKSQCCGIRPFSSIVINKEFRCHVFVMSCMCLIDPPVQEISVLQKDETDLAFNLMIPLKWMTELSLETRTIYMIIFKGILY